MTAPFEARQWKEGATFKGFQTRWGVCLVPLSDFVLDLQLVEAGNAHTHGIPEACNILTIKEYQGLQLHRDPRGTRLWRLTVLDIRCFFDFYQALWSAYSAAPTQPGHPSGADACALADILEAFPDLLRAYGASPSQLEYPRNSPSIQSITMPAAAASQRSSLAPHHNRSVGRGDEMECDEVGQHIEDYDFGRDYDRGDADGRATSDSDDHDDYMYTIANEADDHNTAATHTASRQESRILAIERRVPSRMIRQYQGRPYVPQSKVCNAQKYQILPKCFVCRAKTRKENADKADTEPACCFLWKRFMPADWAGGFPFPSPQFLDQEHTPLRFEYPTLDRRLAGRAQTATVPDATSVLGQVRFNVARQLKDIIEREVKHAQQHEGRKRNRELGEHQFCDYCRITLLFGSFLCDKCGREFCLPCAAAIADPAGKKDNRCLKKGRCRVDQCFRGREKHTSSDLVAYTRIGRDELDAALRDIAAVVETEPAPGNVDPAFRVLTAEEVAQDKWRGGIPLLCPLPIGELEYDWLLPCEHVMVQVARTDVDAETPPCSKVPLLQFMYSLGGSCTDKARTFGEGEWQLQEIDCSANTKGSLLEMVPELIDHFYKVLPMPDRTRPNAPRNLAAYFPLRDGPPDLGPKLMAIWASSEETVTGTGTRKLTIRQTSIMYISTEEKSGVGGDRRGGAIWTFFPPESYAGLCMYLRKISVCEDCKDPVLSGDYFLTTQQLLALESKGVKWQQLHQGRGDAILIPAGCAYQVRYLADSLEVSTGFVDDECIQRTAAATRTFASLSNGFARDARKDLLHFETMLWHAWKATSVQCPPQTDRTQRPGRT